MHLIKVYPQEQEIEKEFHVSVYIIAYKFLLGVIEFAAGVAVAFYGSSLYHLYQASVVKELTEDPHDVLARLSETIVPNLLTHHSYVMISLLVLGVAKMAGAIGLMYKQNWGVDLLVSLTVIMAPFQIVSLILHPHIFDVIYFVVGLLIALYLIQFKPKAWISRLILRFN
jgi:uncharacterized membrane protein (DUF2068 family)